MLLLHDSGTWWGSDGRPRCTHYVKGTELRYRCRQSTTLLATII